MPISTVRGTRGSSQPSGSATSRTTGAGPVRAASGRAGPTPRRTHQRRADLPGPRRQTALAARKTAASAASRTRSAARSDASPEIASNTPPEEPRRREPASCDRGPSRAERRSRRVFANGAGAPPARAPQQPARGAREGPERVRPAAAERRPRPTQEERHRGGDLDERPERERGGRPELAARDRARGGRRPRRDQQVVVPARALWNSTTGFSPTSATGERLAFGRGPNGPGPPRRTRSRGSRRSRSPGTSRRHRADVVGRRSVTAAPRSWVHQRRADRRRVEPAWTDEGGWGRRGGSRPASRAASGFPRVVRRRRSFRRAA